MEKICEKALLTFGSHERTSTIQLCSADGSRRAAKEGPQLGDDRVIQVLQGLKEPNIG